MMKARLKRDVVPRYPELDTLDLLCVDLMTRLRQDGKTAHRSTGNTDTHRIQRIWPYEPCRQMPINPVFLSSLLRSRRRVSRKVFQNMIQSNNNLFVVLRIVPYCAVSSR